MAKRSKDSYDVAQDRPVAPVRILHVSESNGALVSGFGEGVASFAIALRTMPQGEDGAPGAPKVAIAACYQAKRAANRPGWTLGKTNAEGLAKASLVETIPEGATVIGTKIGRLSPAVAVTLHTAAAEYAAKVVAAMKAQKKKGRKAA